MECFKLPSVPTNHAGSRSPHYRYFSTWHHTNAPAGLAADADALLHVLDTTGIEHHHHLVDTGSTIRGALHHPELFDALDNVINWFPRAHMPPEQSYQIVKNGLAYIRIGLRVGISAAHRAHIHDSLEALQPGTGVTYLASVITGAEPDPRLGRLVESYLTTGRHTHIVNAASEAAEILERADQESSRVMRS